MTIDTTVGTYDPSQIILTFGPIILTGYAEGTFVSIARNGDIFEKRKGSDGSIDRINKQSNDFSVTIRLTLKRTMNSFRITCLKQKYR